jgi:SWI/SNF-related matrix-associated actin-dependent regulator of chromatin subfamily A member 5
MVVKIEDENLPVYGDHIYENSGKMNLFHKLVAKLIKEGYKILVFAFFKGLLDIIEDYCEYKKIKYPRFDGYYINVDR